MFKAGVTLNLDTVTKLPIWWKLTLCLVLTLKI